MKTALTCLFFILSPAWLMAQERDINDSTAFTISKITGLVVLTGFVIWFVFKRRKKG